MQIFPDVKSAREYLESRRWEGTPVCPHCGAYEHITARGGSRTGYYRCRDCSQEFTVRTGTIFERSHVALNKWLFAMYLVVTARKGVSSLQMSKEIGVTQKTAWFMLQRIREACGSDFGKLSGIIEVDETFIGGKESAKHASKKLHAGRGTVGKQAVMGFRERGGRSVARPIDGTDGETLKQEIAQTVDPGATVYTDDHRGYLGLAGYDHASVNHSSGEYVGAGSISTNSVESMWAVLKRALYGTWHQVSRKHLTRYVNECTFRLNEGNVKNPTQERIDSLVDRSFRHHISYERLTE